MKENIIEEKSISFALAIIKLYAYLQNKREYIISKQLLRSWTSIWANIAEASAGQSKRDFLAKMYISAKEARETRYRLNLLEKSRLVDYDYQRYLVQIQEIINILSKITKTTQSSIRH